MIPVVGVETPTVAAVGVEIQAKVAVWVEVAEVVDGDKKTPGAA